MEVKKCLIQANIFPFFFIFIILVNVKTFALDAPCPFNATQTCHLERDILNDKNQDGLLYYSGTNFDDRMTGEINLYQYSAVVPYEDSQNFPGQIKLQLYSINDYFYSGEIRTRKDLNLPPFNSPVLSAPWTTKELQHGYIEVIVRMPKCEQSDNNLCIDNTMPIQYNQGLWPTVRLLPTNDTSLPANGIINLGEAYAANQTFNLGIASLSFPQTTSYVLANILLQKPLYTDFHTWGLEWRPDPYSPKGGQVLTGYFDHQVIWGPLQTDNLPGEGADALARGFNDPEGGYYLNINLALGGPFAGEANPHLQKSSLYIQSAKAYEVLNSSSKRCLPPINISEDTASGFDYSWFYWSPPNGDESAPISTYIVIDPAAKKVLYHDTGPAALMPTCSDGPFYFYSVCGDQRSAPAIFDMPKCLKVQEVRNATKA